MTLLFRISSLIFFIAALASGIWGIKESSWIYLALFGVFSTFSTFLIVLTNPVSQEH